jgi:hypothetical protein
MRYLAPSIIAAFVVAACGGGSSTPTPTTPTPTAPTATGLSISGTDQLRTGQSQTYAATVNLSNGTTQAATSPTWTSDNQSVMTITSAGQAAALTHGTSTLTATAQGQSATRLVKVYQDYQGTWTGAYRIRTCDDQGDFKNLFCADIFPRGALLPIRITLTQPGSTASGTLELGNIVHTLSGGIFDTRHFVGAANGTFSDSGITLTSRTGTLDILSTATSLTGTIINTITASGFSGNVYIEADLSGVTRTSSLAEPSPRRTFSSLPEFVRGFSQ